MSVFLEYFVGVLILLGILGVCFFMMYIGLNGLHKYFKR